jgi:hypothetical protein
MGDTIQIYVQDNYRIRFLGSKNPEILSVQIFSYELIGILKRSLVPEDTKIIITALPETPANSVYYIKNLLRWNGYNHYSMESAKSDISVFFQDSLFEYNEKLKKKLERDINIDIANLKRNVCSLLPVSFAMDSLDKVHVLPKYVLIEPVDYELAKHYLMRNIQLNYKSLQIRKNWAYCLDLVVCPEKMLLDLPSHTP